MVIAIDAGHGTIDHTGPTPRIVTPGKRHQSFFGAGIGCIGPGPVSRTYTFVEGIWNRAAAEAIEKALHRAGVATIRTYHPWRDWSLTRRAAIASFAKADLLLSIHANAGGGQGFECYHNGHTDAIKAGNAIAAMYDLYDLGPLRLPPVKDNYRGFAILRKSTRPALILEAAFFDNKEDQKKLTDREWVYMYAEAIASAIISIKN